nr:hypothetical protein [Actinomadura sp. J1-007]
MTVQVTRAASPLASAQPSSSSPQPGQPAASGANHRSHASHRLTTSRSRAVPSKNGSVRPSRRSTPMSMLRPPSRAG